MDCGQPELDAKRGEAMLTSNEIQVLIEYAPLVVGFVLVGFSWF
jgi:hypothetical protein